MNVVVWGENIHEHRNAVVGGLYPRGMHTAIADALAVRLPDCRVTTATLQEEDHGLAPDRLADVDVLLWWGHLAHGQVIDTVAARVQARVHAGMGLVVLHSGHLSKPFRLLMGTSCNLRWREAKDRELVWTVAPDHPIAAGVPHPLVIPTHEMYGEFFDIPAPDELVFVSSFSGGEVFRSGCCFHRGRGRVFYFSPGHETYPVYHQPEIGNVLANAVRWAAPPEGSGIDNSQCFESATGWFEPVAAQPASDREHDD